MAQLTERLTALSTGLSAAVLALSPALAAADVKPAASAKTPILLKSLTKEQIKRLGDDDPIDVGGRVTTKAQTLAEIRRLKPQTDVWVAQKASAAAARFQKAGLELASSQKARIESNNIKALAAVAALRQQVEQQKTDPKPTPCAGPHLSSVSTGSTAIYPGMAAFLAAGACFSAQQGNGKLRIEWISDGGSYSPPVTLWNDHLVMVTIPDSLTGLKEQDALVSIVRSDGSASNKATVHFVPLLDTKTIYANDGALVPVCSMGADINDCDPSQGRTFDGVHANTVDITDDTGTDKVKVSLKNGWVLKDKEWEVGNWLSGGGASITYPVGQASTDVTMHFFVHPFGYVRFYAIFLIEGPRGVGHK
jgi:hypothetical protein